MKRVMLSHGNGGEENANLIESVFLKHLKNEMLVSEDAAILELGGKIAVSTDSFIVTPLFFKGGDIGKLSICGTCNDLSMRGAKPLYLTCGFIIEEGFEIERLERIVLSMSEELKLNGAKIVAGDTKVAPRGSVDGLFINTTGIGKVVCEGLSSSLLESGDTIIVSGNVGEHGAAIFAEREGIELGGDLKSDCASLWGAVKELFDAGIVPKTMRDATRGGLASVLNEWAHSSNCAIEVEHSLIPISDAVKGICEILGFEPYSLANEGMFVVAVKECDAQKTLNVLRSHQSGKNSAIIGRVSSGLDKRVILRSMHGTKRILEYPSGELLPRIC